MGAGIGGPVSLDCIAHILERVAMGLGHRLFAGERVVIPPEFATKLVESCSPIVFLRIGTGRNPHHSRIGSEKVKRV